MRTGDAASGHVADLEVQIEIVRAVAPLADEWERLAERLSAPLFLRPGWASAWWRAFGAGELLILAARRGRQLEGVVPLQQHRGVLRSASNWHTPEFGLLAASDEARAALAQRLFALAPRRISLAFVDADAPDLDRCCAAAQVAGYRVLSRTLERSPYLLIQNDWETFVARLGKSVRVELPRRLRRLSERGDVEIEVADGSVRLDDLLDEGFAAEGSGWKARRGTAISSKLETETFYREIARWAADRGWLQLAFLRLDGRALAFHLNLEQNRVCYHLKGGYDETYARFSPGRLLTHAVIKRAFRLGSERYEFLGGDEPYKLAWTETCRDRRLFQAFKPSVAGRVDWAAFAVGRPFAKRVVDSRWVGILRRWL